ncbi:nucleoside triphosphate pyrophosphohydrolase family protein [Apilactobacillus xinyiensis]|uniref:Nucleoside triphosphate pyrophosphohydrolase family protein n=1 Tax=Apilactobacillus xinyiensis TaxID=2841032 RepID=A0ABT0I1W3_9LACO|nr:nucleoside triphosphate pyrophosphohydrolase family protein [Apilactobacillus xinyiensis]MCK8624706.1 nucleoside triphosphate pyrophosphohydrolase family protein [Apilactobacillus xinyiensis]MCL0312373.1 nucleoside triphosphate pyrophosphohydrolase family protein [Apilactobacillus xinyiensis]MCL0318821.1 nucleoside triphosphate pyrophosphohydrolase family protein [Apilactobacillus xinyiensis]MCL0329937.1 nucleoside triphosphate pyrophosphohydrolase family protein [Apilactobacillus xinyiensis
MNFDEYQKEANKTLIGDEQVLTNCALGLASETGQLVDLVKKYTFHGEEMSKEQLTKEMGDVLWYLSQVAQWNDINFDDVAKYNIKRLRNKKNNFIKK